MIQTKEKINGYTVDTNWCEGYGWTVYVWYNAFLKGEGKSCFRWLASWRAWSDLWRKLRANNPAATTT